MSKVDLLGNTLDQPESEISTSTKSHIHELPLEILIQIFSNLDPIELNTIRLVCKRWRFAVSDKETWLNSFSLKFGTSGSFPSLTDSRHWMVEYFDRLKCLKKWNKAVAIHKSYSLINNEFRNVETCLSSFNNNDGWGKIMTFSPRFGNIAICNLKNGRNQSFIPGGNNVFGQVYSYDMNWNFLLMGRGDGDLVLKNLLTSTSSGANRSSQSYYTDESDSSKSPITAVCLNSLSNMDKYKRRVDIISGSLNGKLKLWNLNKELVKTIGFDNESIINVKSDFKNYIVVNTQATVYCIHYSNHSVLARIPLGFEIELDNHTFVPSNYFWGTPGPYPKNTLDVDFGDCNIVVTYRTYIRAYNYRSPGAIKTRELDLPNDIFVTLSSMQTCPSHKVRTHSSRNVKIAGSDELLYANALSDGSVITWKVRDFSTKHITPQCKIVPEFSKHSPDLSEYTGGDNFRPITAIALNGVVVAIGGYNGFTNLHNVFTGEFIKEASVKYPKKMAHMYSDLVPVNKILLNDVPRETNGLIVCGDAIQYFQFGETELLNSSTTSGSSASFKKKVNSGVLNKHESKKKIRDQIDDYDTQIHLENERQKMFEKYNGSFDEEDELSIALAMSESQTASHSHSDLDNDLAQALELSRLTHSDSHVPQERVPDPEVAMTTGVGADDDDEQLRRILELSLIEQ